MNISHQEMLDLFVANCQQAKDDFFWKNTLSRRLAALLYAADARPIDTPAIRQAEADIKARTGFLSAFRGNSLMTVATLLSLTANPVRSLDDTLQVYALMKEERFHSSDFLVVAACLIATRSDQPRWSQSVSRAKAFYDAMKSAHYFLTGQDDHIYAAMFGMSNTALQEGIDRMEAIYADLKSEFLSKNSLQALSVVLMLGSRSSDAVRRVLALKQAFRDQKLKMDQVYTLSSLGVLALLPQDDACLTESVRSLEIALRSRPGFSPLSISKQERLLFAASIIAYSAAGQTDQNLLAGAVSTSIASIVIAQQTAAVIAASSAASAAASASH